MRDYLITIATATLMALVLQHAASPPPPPPHQQAAPPIAPG
ncbi:hypothetical protein [Sphingomonas sp. SUN019]|nr:hypothetical protein [Sphingomonas sp. SUN019]